MFEKIQGRMNDSMNSEVGKWVALLEFLLQSDIIYSSQLSLLNSGNTNSFNSNCNVNFAQHQIINFPIDEIRATLSKATESVLGDKSYCEEEVGGWSNEVCERCVKELTLLEQPFKYVGKRRSLALARVLFL